ncbi:MAG TPA: type II secretion system F family protein [Actinomycetota bacterium]
MLGLLGVLVGLPAAADGRAGTVRPRAAGPAAAVSPMGAPVSALQAQGDLGVSIKRLQATGDGRALATVALTGPAAEGPKLDAEAFTVTIGGRPAEVTRVQAPGTTPTQVSALLVIDTSNSMNTNDNIGKAKAAALNFVDQLEPGGQAGLLPFATAPAQPTVLTGDKAKLVPAIGRLHAAGETALFDAVTAAATVLRSHQAGQRAVILLSDGADTSSRRSLDDAVAAARKARVTVYAIGLNSGASLPGEALTKLAKQTGGRYIAANAADLGKLYTSLGQELYSQYRVEVEVPPGSGTERPVVVTVRAGSASASAGGVLFVPAAHGPVGLDQQSVPGLRGIEQRQVLYYIAALMFAAVLLLAWALMSPLPGGGKTYRELRQRLSQYSLTSALADDQPPSALGSSELLGKAAEMAESLIKRTHLEDTLLTRLELAGLKLRVAEFALFWLATALLLPLLLLALSRNLLIALAGVMLGALLPFVLLIIKATRRQRAFDEQLPDALQLLSGALQAGHSLLQAIDTAVKEAGEPMSVEFQRVLTEARLGMPLEEALDGMAKRMNSQDFEWTVMAVGLQRQIGGNLAELLNAVAQTMRERYSLKRQIRALSAEGRLSSYILSILPFVMFFLLLMFNSTFLSPLYSTPTGLVLLCAAAVLMITGIIWMKKITDIQV